MPGRRTAATAIAFGTLAWLTLTTGACEQSAAVSEAGPPAAQASSQRATGGAAEGPTTCPGVARAAFHATVVDANNGEKLCDATVVATDVHGRELKLSAAPERCEYVAWGGWEGTFEVVASKLDRSSKSKPLVVRKQGCDFSGRDVRLEL
jgi:hypothetical protein